MIGAKSFDGDDEIRDSCEPTDFTVGLKLGQKMYGTIAETKGCILQQIQIAVHSQETHRISLEHLQHIPQTSNAITHAMHNTLVDRLRSLSRFYSHSSKTFFLAVSIMDRFLTVVKVKPRHLLCIAVASYYLAVKSVEKAKDVMSPEHLVRISQCACLKSDIARMERILTSKLNWDLDAPSPLTFLQLFHAWCVAEGVLGNNADQHRDHVDRLTSILEASLCHFPLALCPPSVLAFSLMDIELPRYVTLHNTSDLDNLEWVLTGLQHFTKMSVNEVQHCKSHLRDFLLDYCSPKCKVPTSKLVWIVSTRTAKNMRFTAQCSSDLETIPENCTMSSNQDYLTNSSCSEKLWEKTSVVAKKQQQPVMVVTAPSTQTVQYSDASKKCLLPEVKRFRFPNHKHMAFCVL